MLLLLYFLCLQHQLENSAKKQRLHTFLAFLASLACCLASFLAAALEALGAGCSDDIILVFWPLLTACTRRCLFLVLVLVPFMTSSSVHATAVNTNERITL